MATIYKLTLDRVEGFDFFAQRGQAACNVVKPRAPRRAVWTLNCRRRLACHLEIDIKARLIQSG